MNNSTKLAGSPQQAVAQVFGLYERHGGDDYIGEPVSQLEHMWQAAALAEAVASLATLAFQGGVMSAAEAAAFEQDPDADLLVQLRQQDEQAKETNRPVGSLAHLKALALKHLLAQ